MDTYAQDVDPAATPAAPLDQLFACLSDPGGKDLGLVELVERAVESTASSVTPSAEQRAMLSWLDVAHRDWITRYPLAEPLAQVQRDIRPLAAALALTDREFTQPGAHPLHRLLDRVVASAIGWQPEVVRAQSTRQLIEETAEAALAWLENRDLDITAICESCDKKMERESSRAQKMARRSVEAEQGRARADEARRESAKLINECLRDSKIPMAISDLIKGPWYDSAQLVLLKFGKGSRQWAAMSETTANLLESLKPIDSASPERKQQVFEIVANTPKEMRRWLLSLHHDQEALDEAVGLVEFTHLKILRQQELEVDLPDPIVTGEHEHPTSGHADRIRGIKPGGWFVITQGENDPRRLQLSLNLGKQRQLFFTDHAGLKALQLGYDDFEVLLKERRVKKLPHEASFSECLARSAGIDSVEALRELLKAQPAETGVATELPMGVWLGFHDGEAPLLAKLAVHDPQSNQYIFVNREGIKVREVTSNELKSLMNNGQVEILESRNNFQEQVKQAREESGQSSEEA